MSLLLASVKRPEPVITVVEPVPAPKPEHQKEDDHLLSILASINQEEGNAISSETEPEMASEQSEISLLLASLGSRGSAPSTDSVDEQPAQTQGDLAAYVQELENNPNVEVETEPVVAEARAPVSTPVGDGPVRYVTSSKSANILIELLTKEQPKASASLDSFLDGLVEDINDKH